MGYFGGLCYKLPGTTCPCCGLDKLPCFQTVPGCSSGVRMGKSPLTNLLTEQKLHVIFTGRFMPVLPSVLENSSFLLLAGIYSKRPNRRMTRQSHLSVHPISLSCTHKQEDPVLEFLDSWLCSKLHRAHEKPWTHSNLPDS